jgi:hypothetical protein
MSLRNEEDAEEQIDIYPLCARDDEPGWPAPLGISNSVPAVSITLLSAVKITVISPRRDGRRVISSRDTSTNVMAFNACSKLKVVGGKGVDPR